MRNAIKPSAPAPDEQPLSTTRVQVFTVPLHRIRGERGAWIFDEAPPAPPEPVRRPARVAQLLSLAHRLRSELDRGVHQGVADLAAKVGFTAARISQILGLTLLAPDVQEEILFIEAEDGVEPLTERALREQVLQHEVWADQRAAWQRLRGKGRARRGRGGVGR